MERAFCRGTLNRPHPQQAVETLSETETIKEIPSGPITKAEIRSAIISMNAGKLPGVDCIKQNSFKLTLRQQLMYFMTFFLRYGIVRLFQWTGVKILFVRLSKKGGLTKCGNCRGITLMPVVAKVMCKALITRIADGVDENLRKEQEGFRKERSTVEQIFVLRILVEQALAFEWNASLFLCFVDYEKAFDSVHRETRGRYGEL